VPLPLVLRNPDLIVGRIGMALLNINHSFDDLGLTIETLKSTWDSETRRDLPSHVEGVGAKIDLLEDALRERGESKWVGDPTDTWMIRSTFRRLTAACTASDPDWEQIGVLISFLESGVQRLRERTLEVETSRDEK
jgi:hypothetical protein